MQLYIFSLAFFSAFFSHFIDRRTNYDFRFYFLSRNPLFLLQCGIYGFIGCLSLQLLIETDAPVRSNDNHELVSFFELSGIALATGFTSKGILETPIIPMGGKGSFANSLKISSLLNLLIRDKYFESYMAKNAVVYYSKISDSIIDKGKTNNDFLSATKSYLNEHPSYGASNESSKIGEFNSFVVSLGDYQTLSDSIRYIHKSLGRDSLNSILKMI